MPSSNYTTDAIVLLAHGSRDPRPQLALTALAEQVKQRLAHGVDDILKDVLVFVAWLELAPKPLHQQLVDIAQQASRAGRSQLHILPLFLLPGVHVMQDIPAEVALAAQLLTAQSRSIVLNLLPYLGQHPHLVHLLASQAAEAELGNTGITARILLTHGSNHPASNSPIEALASQLTAITAYWSKAPSLEQQVSTLAQQGYDSITILPYFLFAGKTTDSIAQQVIQLAAKYPTQQLRLAALISTHLQFTDVIANWLNLVQSQLQTV